MKIDDLKFYTTDVTAYAAQMKETALQTWLRRKEGIGTGSPEAPNPLEGGGKQGLRRYWTFRNVMEVSIANRLFTSGLGLDLALQAGAFFAYVGTLPGSMAEDVVLGKPGNGLMRIPGLPFHDPDCPDLKTLAIVSQKGCAVVGWGKGYDPLKEANVRLGGLSAWSSVECREVFFDVCGRLGLQPFDLINAEYGAKA